MRKRFQVVLGLLLAIYLALPALVEAAGGPATMLVVVADTRRVTWGAAKYFANLYNTNIWLFSVWAVVLTAAWGAILGFIMDAIMSRTGIDLKSRKIVEH